MANPKEQMRDAEGVSNTAGRPSSPLVAEGRAAIAAEASAPWRLGDLALEVEPMALRGRNTGATGRLAEYAKAVGLSYPAVLKYRQVADAWPVGKRFPAVSWSVHMVLQAPAHQPLLTTLVENRKPVTVAAAKRAMKSPSPSLGPEADEYLNAIGSKALEILREIAASSWPHTERNQAPRRALVRKGRELLDQIEAGLDAEERDDVAA